MQLLSGALSDEWRGVENSLPLLIEHVRSRIGLRLDFSLCPNSIATKAIKLF